MPVVKFWLKIFRVQFWGKSAQTNTWISVTFCSILTKFGQNVVPLIIIINNNQYIYKQRQSHAMSQRRWLATAVIFRPSDMSLGFAKTWTVIAPATAETLEGGSNQCFASLLGFAITLCFCVMTAHFVWSMQRCGANLAVFLHVIYFGGCFKKTGVTKFLLGLKTMSCRELLRI